MRSLPIQSILSYFENFVTSPWVIVKMSERDARNIGDKLVSSPKNVWLSKDDQKVILSVGSEIKKYFDLFPSDVNDIKEKKLTFRFQLIGIGLNIKIV
jgi:hypothetical protein